MPLVARPVSPPPLSPLRLPSPSLDPADEQDQSHLLHRALTAHPHQPGVQPPHRSVRPPSSGSPSTPDIVLGGHRRLQTPA